MVSERHYRRTEPGVLRGRAKGAAATGSGIVTRVIGLLVVVLLAGDAAFADYIVQPMLVRKAVLPGRRVTIPMNIQNMDPARDETITLSLKELSQSPDASWIELSPTDPNLSKYPIRSCREWVSIPPGEIVVGAYKMQPFTVQIDVPGGTNGFYFAAIVASTAPRPVTDETGVVTFTQVDMVAPVVLEVQSLPPPRKIALVDIGLEHRAETVDDPATSLVTVDIANTGGTFSAILPVVSLWAQSAGHWRKLSDVRLTDTGILPGAKLHLRQDLGRPLASGPYRMAGYLYVDGRRAGYLQKELTFQGDDRQKNPASEIALDIQPANTFLEILPGATRSGNLQVVNASEESVRVRADLMLPPHMQGVVLGQVQGDDLSCADWVTVTPREFTMRGYSRQNLQLLARMPKGAAQYPAYYGLLRLQAVYSGDGQPAGTRETYVCVRNQQATATPALRSSVLTISEASPSRYLVTAAYTNGGETYITPSCRGVLSMAGVGGITNVKQFLLSSENYGQKAIMLPFETRVFTGILDISDVDRGVYYLTSALRWSEAGAPADGVQGQITIIVDEQGGRKTATMTTPQPGAVIKLM